MEPANQNQQIRPACRLRLNVWDKNPQFQYNFKEPKVGLELLQALAFAEIRNIVEKTPIKEELEKNKELRRQNRLLCKIKLKQKDDTFNSLIKDIYSKQFNRKDFFKKILVNQTGTQLPKKWSNYKCTKVWLILTTYRFYGKSTGWKRECIDIKIGDLYKNNIEQEDKLDAENLLLYVRKRAVKLYQSDYQYKRREYYKNVEMSKKAVKCKTAEEIDEVVDYLEYKLNEQQCTIQEVNQVENIELHNEGDQLDFGSALATNNASNLAQIHANNNNITNDINNKLVGLKRKWKTYKTYV